MLGEDVYGGVPFTLLPVAAGYPTGGGSLLIDKHQNICQVCRTLYIVGEDVYGGMPFPLLPVAAGYPAGGQPSLLIDKHQNSRQVYRT
jgi:hypothetical protein